VGQTKPKSQAKHKTAKANKTEGRNVDGVEIGMGRERTNAQDGEMEKRMAGASDICDIINLLYNTQNFMNVRQL